MTVENLHDAIGLLPSDLIAKVDEKRCRRPKVIPWRRYAAMAACLALMVGGTIFFTLSMASGGSKEAAAPEMMQAADHSGRFDAPAAMAPEQEEAAPEAPAAMAEENNAIPEEPAENQAIGGYPTIETYAAGEIPPEGVTEEVWEGHPEFLAADVQYAPTRNIGTGATTSDPIIQILRSPAELQQFRERFGGRYTMDAFDTCCEIYEENWFETHDLLVVLVKGLPEDGVFSLASVTESNGDWCIRFLSGGPYTGETVDRFVFAQLDKDTIPEGSKLFAMFEVP